MDRIKRQAGKTLEISITLTLLFFTSLVIGNDSVVLISELRDTIQVHCLPSERIYIGYRIAGTVNCSQYEKCEYIKAKVDDGKWGYYSARVDKNGGALRDSRDTNVKNGADAEVLLALMIDAESVTFNSSRVVGDDHTFPISQSDRAQLYLHNQECGFSAQ